jgi:hypothetical protein
MCVQCDPELPTRAWRRGPSSGACRATFSRRREKGQFSHSASILFMALVTPLSE